MGYFRQHGAPTELGKKLLQPVDISNVWYLAWGWRTSWDNSNITELANIHINLIENAVLEQCDANS